MTRRGVLIAAGAALLVAAAALAVAVLPGPGGDPAARWGPAAASPPVAASPPAAVASATASPSVAATCGPWDCAFVARFSAAAASIKGKPGYLGIMVTDRRTGQVWRAGTPEHVMWLGSTTKLALATSLLERSRSSEITLDATAHRQLDAMFATSDDHAADALWDRYGGASLLSRFRDRYGMTGLTFVPGFRQRWGFMKATAADLTHLMSYVLDRLDATDRGYVVGAMRHVDAIQQWGVWAAGSSWQPGTKDGWSIESDPGGKHWCTSTVGFAGPDQRYVVVAMYHLPPGSGTIDAGVHAVSDLVATVFGAATPATVTVPDPSTGT